MDNEYEYDDEEQENVAGFNRANGNLPESVMTRVEKHAERTNEKVDVVLDFFLESIKKDYGCDNPQEEDEDLLIDWFEQCYVQLRRATVSGGSNSTAFVGCFIGVDGNKRDRRANMVRRASRDFTMDPNAAIDSGKVGVYEKEGDFWKIVTSNGSLETVEPVDTPPSMGFLADGQYICLLGSTTGRPMVKELMGRHYFFLGNEENKFESEILMWRVDATGDDVDMEVKVGEPCKIYVRPPNANAPEAYRDILGTSYGFSEKIEYTDKFVGESERRFLHPSKYLTSRDMHNFFVPLEDLDEAYESGSRTFEINGEQGRSGPVVITKGTVNRLSTEARETQYDQSGKNYVFNLTSVALQSQFGEGRAAEVGCWVSGACHDLTAPFVARDDTSEIEWAEKSTVYVIGRVGVSVKDNERVAKLNVFGVYADPRRIRPRIGGGNTGQEQFN